MDRKEFESELLKVTESNILIEAATGYGKSKMAILKAKEWYKDNCKILIVYPKCVLKDNWIAEFKKFNCEFMLKSVTFSTYASFHKHIGTWDIVILDEVHHLSERCRLLYKDYKVKHTIMLSATIKRELREWIKRIIRPLKHMVVDIKEAIESDVLPEPRIITIPLMLDNLRYTKIYKQKSKNTQARPITIPYTEKWKYKSYPGEINLKCTQKQYYNELSSLIDWFKRRAEANGRMRQVWLSKCGERLKWLAGEKEDIIKSILKDLKNYRMLTFCGTIEQSENLNTPCVHSKIGLGNLELFNDKKIKHISCVAQLDEGINLNDCRIGLFQMINSSVRLIVQRSGRIYRHSKPILIFPYYRYTREEEIVNDIVKDYKDVHTLTSTSEILKIIKDM